MLSPFGVLQRSTDFLSYLGVGYKACARCGATATGFIEARPQNGTISLTYTCSCNGAFDTRTAFLGDIIHEAQESGAAKLELESRLRKLFEEPPMMKYLRAEGGGIL